MYARNLHVPLLLLEIILFAAPARAVTYTATLLHPVGHHGSHARGVSGAIQVGDSDDDEPGGDFPHALLWNGSPESVVDLNPPGFITSYATSVSGTNQVGYGGGTATGGGNHALL